MTRIVAINYDDGMALFNIEDNQAVIVDINSRDVVSKCELSTALTASSWLRVAPDIDYPSVWRELADAAVTDIEVKEKEAPAVAERRFRVPLSVKNEARQAIDWVNGFERGSSALGMGVAKQLVEDNYITLSKLQRIARYFARRPDSIMENSGWTAGQSGFPTNDRIKYSLWGGEPAREWVAKVSKKHPLLTDVPVTEDPDSVVAGAFEHNPDADYFGKGQDPDSTYVTELYMLQGDDQWSMYDGTAWVDVEPPAEDAVIIMLDPESVQKLADFIDNRDPENQEQGIELSTLNPFEAAMFSAADSEIDWEFVDRVFDIYDSQERSVNAKKQVRSAGGKFGDEPDAPDSKKETTAETKARLPQALPLVPDLAARIDQYLADVAKKRGAETPAPAAPAPEGGDAAPAAQASLSEEYKNAVVAQYANTKLGRAEFAGEPGGVTDVRPLYLAIVDSVDTEAVLDVISLVPPAAWTQGDVTVWKRNAGAWVQANDILADLRGTSPPPVVELSDDAMLTAVLEQVDKATSDSEEETAPTQPTSPAPAKPDANPDQHPIPAQASIGYSLPDGSFAIRNVDQLRDALALFRIAKNPDLARAHITKRARALNRLDLLPKEWDRNERESGYAMWGPHGEIISLVAAQGGLDKNRGNAEKLRRYWVHGEGAAKIRWGEPNDWYRCVSHLSKYLGVRAKGYCTLRHHDALGSWPGQEGKH